MRKKLRLFFISIIFISICLIIFYSSPSSSSSNINEIGCEPILKTNNQFYVTIDGEQYPKIIPTFFNTSINFNCLNKNTKSKLILLWNDYGPWKDYKYGIGKYEPFKNRKCPVYNCEITNDRSRLDESDLVLVHMRGNLNNLPINRPKKTRSVFLITESPIHTLDLNKYDGVFNLTATYNLNSDFSPFYYSNIEFKWQLDENYIEKDYSKLKSKLAAILVSNCNAPSKRIDYVKEMQKYASIDIYGGCGISCNIKNENHFLNSKPCREIISKDYKFLLAFENSICVDYITEKFFETLTFDIVPVVLGYGSYDKWIPKSAYINALDFESPKHLAEYLIYLSNNSTAYNSYFKWKKYIKKTNNQFKTICDMCIKLNLENYFGIQETVFKNVDDFWGLKKNCLQPSIENGVFKYIPFSNDYTHKCSVC